MDGHLERYVLFFVGHAVVHGRRKRHFLVFADKPSVDMPVVGEEQRVTAFPSDGESLPANLYSIEERKVVVQVVCCVAQIQAIDCAPERGDIVLREGDSRNRKIHDEDCGEKLFHVFFLYTKKRLKISHASQGAAAISQYKFTFRKKLYTAIFMLKKCPFG